MTKPATINPKLIDQLLAESSVEDLLGENGLIKQFAFLAPTPAPSGLGPQSDPRAGTRNRNDHTSRSRAR